MTRSELVFWLVAAPFLAFWLVLGARYTRASARWFDELRRRRRPAEEIDTLVERALARVPRRPQLLFFTASALADALRSPLRLFRADPDPEVERLRQEAVERYLPMLSILAVGVAIWFVVFVVALGAIVGRALLS